MKNIVLLSDGTGNGAAKRHRTNVWRLYQALDLQSHDQVAFYDDGVGSQEFLPLKIIGGVFGYGLKRNVIELYKSLCRSYEEKEKDKIFLFGFSRGAFTVRVLASMIGHCGVYGEYRDEDDLHKTAVRNYNAFRSRFKGGLLNRLVRFLCRTSNESKCTTRPDIEFIGVWDTVDAYGLPIDELAILWHKLIFPIRFPDRQLSTKVKRACHALSIDDERHTFHPVLWDESEERGLAEEGEVPPNRIEQVWFSGVHSDVGGGYPLNDLSLVPLDWMISKIEAPGSGGTDAGASDQAPPGLRFIDQVRNEIRSHSNWHGLQHDSRSGFKAYYRYKPRNLALLCDDADNGVQVGPPRIHRSVMERIKGNYVPYAPTGLPSKYQVVTTKGGVPPFETPRQSQRRAEALNAALDIVYWRRRLYAVLLLVTGFFVASRFYLPWQEGGICLGEACLVDPLLGLLEGALPGFAIGWVEALRQNPWALWSFIAAFLALFLLKGKLSAATQSSAMLAWSELKGNGRPSRYPPSATTSLRQAAQTQFRIVIKWLAAIVLFVMILLGLLVFIDRVALHARSTLGGLCEGGENRPIVEDSRVTPEFEIENSCFPTGIRLEAGKTYEFRVEASSPSGTTEPTRKPWMDDEHESTPDGIPGSPFMKVFAPLRRHAFENYLKLIGRINAAGNEEFVIGAGPTEYKAKSTGELFLYVNDVAFGLLPKWDRAYSWEGGENKGSARVAVTCTSCKKQKETEQVQE